MRQTNQRQSLSIAVLLPTPHRQMLISLGTFRPCPALYSKSFQNNKHSHDQKTHFSQTTQKSQKSGIISQISQNLQAQPFTKPNKLQTTPANSQTAPAYSHNVSAYPNEISTNLLPLFTPICIITEACYARNVYTKVLAFLVT